MAPTGHCDLVQYVQHNPLFMILVEKEIGLRPDLWEIVVFAFCDLEQKTQVFNFVLLFM